MPGFHMVGIHLLSPWYEGRRLRRNAALRQVFLRHPHKSPRRKRRRGLRTLAPPLSVSTKDVHGVWITMWISDQYHAVPQHLTHCPIGRQHNPCNSTEMRFFSRNSIGARSADPAQARRCSTVERTEMCSLAGPSSRETRAKSRTSETGESSRFTEHRVAPVALGVPVARLRDRQDVTND